MCSKSIPFLTSDQTVVGSNPPGNTAPLEYTAGSGGPAGGANIWEYIHD